MDTIKVRIRAEQKIYYDQEVEMQKDDYEKVKSQEGCDSFDGSAVIDMYLDKRDIHDWDEIEDGMVAPITARKFEMKLVEVCSECHQSTCYHGEFMCSESRSAGTELKTVSELRELALENEDNWSDENLNKIYGEPAPNGYKGKS